MKVRTTLSLHMQKLGKNRWKNVSKADRIAHSKKMNAARWGKKKTP